MPHGVPSPPPADLLDAGLPGHRKLSMLNEAQLDVALQECSNKHAQRNVYHPRAQTSDSSEFAAGKVTADGVPHNGCELAKMGAGGPSSSLSVVSLKRPKT